MFLEKFAKSSLNSYNILGELSRTVRELREEFAKKFVSQKTERTLTIRIPDHWLPEQFANSCSLTEFREHRENPKP